MNSTLPYKTKQFFFILIKLSIVVGAFYFIYNKLINNGTIDFPEFIETLSKNNVFSIKNVCFLLLFTGFNWFLEIIKWRLLVSSIQKITLKNALEQSLGSLTASLFTPNRIGEYGAKAIYFSKTHRKRILLLNLISNLMQMSITVVLGCIGFWIFSNTYNVEIDYLKLSKGFIIIIVIIGFFILGIKQSKYKIKGFSIKKIKQFIIKLPLKIKVLGFTLSLARYAVFSFQFYILLKLFGVQLSYFEAMTIITSLYLLASIIPSLFIFDVIIKGGVAVYLFSIVGVNELTILCIITLMWLLNFVIPSVFGSYYVLNFNLPKEDLV
jgi:uncharacterized membrane protein YbhN (UPF0104 family)